MEKYEKPVLEQFDAAGQGQCVSGSATAAPCTAGTQASGGCTSSGVSPAGVCTTTGGDPTSHIP